MNRVREFCYGDPVVRHPVLGNAAVFHIGFVKRNGVITDTAELILPNDTSSRPQLCLKIKASLSVVDEHGFVRNEFYNPEKVVLDSICDV